MSALNSTTPNSNSISNESDDEITEYFNWMLNYTDSISAEKEEDNDELWLNNLSYQLLKRVHLFVVAVCLTILLMSFQKRNSLCQKCAKGYFAMIVPVNFLESRRNRITIVAIFVLITVDVFAIFEEEKIGPKTRLLKVFVKMVFVLWSSFLCLPFLICFSADSYMSLFLGIGYALAYGGFIIQETVHNSYNELPNVLQVTNYLNRFYRGIVVTLAGLLMLFGYVRKMYRKLEMKDCHAKRIYKYQYCYARNLLIGNKRKAEEPAKNVAEKLKFFLEKYIYFNVHGFRYSLSILISINAGLVALLYIFINYLGVAIDVYIAYTERWELVKEAKDMQMPNIMQSLTNLIFKKGKVDKWHVTVYEFVKEQISLVFGCIVAAILFAYVLAVISALHMLTSYRENMLSLQRRKRDEHILKMTKTNPIKLVISSIQYTGYQIAYILWGAHFQMLFLTLFLLFVSEFIILPLKYSLWSVLLDLLNMLYPYLLPMYIVKTIQYVLVRFFFLQDKGKILALDNRKGFFTMMYFTLFYTIFMGLFSCLIRMIKSMLLGLWFLPRLDRSIFPRTFERWDNGFKAYSCLLKLEALQSNVIVVSFTNILLECNREKNKESLEQIYIINDAFLSHKSESWSSKRRNLARNRWHVAYTLIQNPDLIKRRGIQALQSQDELEDEPIESVSKL